MTEPGFGECPKHGRYKYQKVGGLEQPIKDCGACALDKLRGEAQAWYENLPAEKKAVLVRQRQIRKLQASKLTWAYYAGCGGGITVGAALGLVILTRGAEPRYFGLAFMAGLLLSFGFTIMRNRTHEELCKLEVERDMEESARLRDDPSGVNKGT